MYKVLLLAIVLPVCAFGQVSTGFESGSLSGWTQSPPWRWEADTTEALSGSFSLHHIFDAGESGSDMTGLWIPGLHASEGKVRWSFIVRHGCDPSSANNWAVFLMSDGLMNPESGMMPDGYAIGVNLTGYDDTLRLWKIKDGSGVKVITCRLNWQNDIGPLTAAIISVERETDGNWIVTARSRDSGLVWSSEGTDNHLFPAPWFSIFYRYTSSRDRLFWFDDLTITGVFRADTIAPDIEICRPSGSNRLTVLFTEDVKENLIDPSYILLNGKSNPLIVNKITDRQIELVFEERLINRAENTLSISNVCDISNNCSGAISHTFIPSWACPGDVIISEIMADPVPEISLPPKEYIEIMNRTTFEFDLTDWSVNAGDGAYSVPPLTIGPGEYIILCSLADTSVFRKYGHTAGMKSFPALYDEGRQIILSDSAGSMIHGIDYTKKWYGSSLKSEGGWSLEIIDPNYPFSGLMNWTASAASEGGTPGKRNSNQYSNRDLHFEGIINVFPVATDLIEVTFSEPLLVANVDANIFVDGSQVLFAIHTDPMLTKFHVVPEQNLSPGKVYTLTLGRGINDYAGNGPESTQYQFGIPAKAGRDDIVFNELLFDPLPGGYDYIEFFNNSDNVFDASDMRLVSVNDNGDTSLVKVLSEIRRCIIPGQHYTITENREHIVSNYFSSVAGNIFELRDLPSMPDDNGHLVLLSRDLEVVDNAIYASGMHHPLLSGREGISLEKVRPEMSSYDPGSWHSASETSGWGTPGAANSIYNKATEVSETVKLSSQRITPDNDGTEDILVIDVIPGGIDCVVSITIFNETGYPIKRLATNYLAAGDASFGWDATCDDGSLTENGNYIILVTIFDQYGRKDKIKRVCSVIR